jgi:hypothetical protein
MFGKVRAGQMHRSESDFKGSAVATLHIHNRQHPELFFPAVVQQFTSISRGII